MRDLHLEETGNDTPDMDEILEIENEDGVNPSDEEPDAELGEDDEVPEVDAEADIEDVAGDK